MAREPRKTIIPRLAEAVFPAFVPSECFHHFGGQHTVVIRSQPQRTECRTERQRIHRRDTHCHRHRQTKLAVEYAARAAHETNRDKHRHEHQRRGDDGYRHILGAVHRCLERVLIARIKAAVHRLYHHHRVVHHSTYHQHQGKQRNQVDGETCHHHKGKCTYQRHYDTDERYQRRAPTLQEQQNNQHHQHNRLQQGVDDILDGGKEEVVGTHHLRYLHPPRRVGLYICQEGVYLLVHLRCIRPCRLKHHTLHALMPV